MIDDFLVIDTVFVVIYIVFVFIVDVSEICVSTFISFIVFDVVIIGAVVRANGS